MGNANAVKRKSSRGRKWLLLLVMAVGIGLYIESQEVAQDRQEQGLADSPSSGDGHREAGSR